MNKLIAPFIWVGYTREHTQALSQMSTKCVPNKSCVYFHLSSKATNALLLVNLNDWIHCEKIKLGVQLPYQIGNIPEQNLFITLIARIFVGQYPSRKKREKRQSDIQQVFYLKEKLIKSHCIKPLVRTMLLLITAELVERKENWTREMGTRLLDASHDEY